LQVADADDEGVFRREHRLDGAVESERRRGRRPDRHPIALLERADRSPEDDLGAARARVVDGREVDPFDAHVGDGVAVASDRDVRRIVDPLDGTTNYLHGFPAFAVSIAVAEKGRLTHGVVYDPLREELYVAVRGRGAFLNDRRIRVGSRPGLKAGLIGTGFPFRDMRNLDAYLAMFRGVLESTAGVRRAGAAALDLAWTAAGRLDGFFELALKPWDIAAGALLVEEAGGIYGSVDGKPGWPVARGDIIAGNPRVFAALAKKLAPHLPAAHETPDAG